MDRATAPELDWTKPAATVAEALCTRRSIRAFLADPVPDETISSLLSLARWAPSGSNIQPWRVHVLRGAALTRLTDAMQAAFLNDEPGHEREYKYYTEPVFGVYLERRRACGWGLYGTLGLTRENKDGMRQQRARNYDFFGAPVGLIFSMDRTLEKGSYIDYGIFLQSIMLAARGKGLHTCPQAAIAEFPNIIRAQLGIGEERLILCGMALGHADPAAVVNGFQPAREAVGDFVTFVG